MRIIPINSINARAKKPADFINFSEEEYRFGIVDVAINIKMSKNKPIILITGPSGSGKTSTAHRLRAELALLGVKAQIISMDNYFLPIKGSLDGIDLESPERMDAPLFKEQTEKILEGREVILPVFDFKEQDRLQGECFSRAENEFVIFEGIHALNPDVTGNLKERSNNVYVSVRTRLKSKTSEIILHPSKIRLSRRFVRDKLFRARTFAQTMEYFENVERGEQLHILPYKKYAEFDIDTFIPYEPCVYKKHLLQLGATHNIKDIDVDLLKILEELVDIGDDFVPDFSLVREFIGGNSLMA